MPRKRLNKNLVVITTLCLFGAMIVLSVVMLSQLRRRDPQYFVERALQCADNAEWESAAVFYRKAWERSNDASHLVSLCDVLLRMGDLNMALAALDAALTSQPDFTLAHVRQLELRTELARLYRRLDDWQKVYDVAEKFLESAAERTPAQEALAHNATGMALIALAVRDESNTMRGESALRQAAEMAPERVEYSIDLAKYLVDTGRAEEGERLLAELVDRFPDMGEDAARVRGAYADWLTTASRFDDAERYFEEAIALAGDSAEAVLESKLGYGTLLSLQWVHARAAKESSARVKAKFERAESLLRSCIDLDPDAFEAYFHLVRLYGSARRHRDIVEVCESRLTRGFSREGIAGRRNQFNTFSLMIQASIASTNEAVAAQQEGDHDARLEWLTRAEQYLADARGELPTHPRVLTQSAQIKLARGLDREALDDLRAAAEAYQSYDAVDWGNTRLLIELHLRLEEPGAALAVVKDVLEAARRSRAGDSDFWTLYARVLLANNELEQALATIDRVLAADPAHIQARQVKAAVYERLGRHREAGQIVESASGDKAVSAILSAQEHILENDENKAIQVLREALEEAPGDPRLVSAVLMALTNQGRWNEGHLIVKQALEANPGDLKLRRLEIMAREDLSDEQRAEEILKLIESEEDAYQRALDLVGFHGQRSDFEKALAWADEALRHLAAKDTPIARNSTLGQHRALLLAKLRLGARLGDEAAMSSARDDAVQFNVDGAAGLSMVGLYYMYTEDYDQAIENLEVAVERQPTDVQSLVALGQCLQVLGRMDDARDSFRRAAYVHPDSGPAHRGLASLALRRGDESTFLAELAICDRLIPDDPWVTAKRIEQKEESDPAAAIAYRETLLAGQENTGDNLRRLVGLCESVGDLEKADKYLVRLIEEEPDARDAVVLAGQYYRRTGRPGLSLAVIRQYIESRPTPEERANAHIILASHYLDTEDLGSVESTLLAALATLPTFDLTFSIAEFYLHKQDQPSRALQWYDEAVVHAARSKPERVADMMERRIRCLMHPKINDLEAARVGISALREADPDNVRTLLLEAEMLARSGQLDDAIASISDYLAQRPGAAAALYKRAQYNNALGNVQSAIDDLKDAKLLDPLGSDLRPRFLLASLYRQTGQQEQSVYELEALVNDAPGSADAVETLAQAYLDSGRLVEAERIITAQINRTANRPGARWFFLRGRISLERGDPGAAIEDVRRGSEVDGYSPQSVGKVLDLYAELNRPSEGLMYLRTHVDEDRLTARLSARRALLLAREGSHAEAVTAFRAAMKLALEEGAVARAEVARTLLGAYSRRAQDPGAVNQAIARFEKGPVPDGIGSANDHILVLLLRYAGRNNEAADRLQALAEACADDTVRAGLLFELGELYQTTNDHLSARTAYERGLSLDPDNWMALNNLAYLLSDALGDFETARLHAERAVELADNSVTLDTRGWISVGLGDYASAIADLSRAISLSSNDPLTYYHLGEAYRRDGQFVAADEVLRRGLSLVPDDAGAEIRARLDESRERAARSESDQ